ncbi:hypothetical protein ACJ41O_003678 [Fusarium nematophilum]
MPETLRNPAAEDSPLPKRRKIRRGTQSCWECKRRKIRCTFAAPTEAVCDGCRSRRTKCISQAFDDDPAANRKSHGDQAMTDESAEPTACGTGPELSSHLQTQGPDEIARALLAAWPSHKDIDLILSVSESVGLSVLFHGVVCMPYAEFFRQIASPRHMLQLPPPGSHPVLIARRLLLLGTLLQGVQPTSAGKLSGMSCDYRAVMSRVVNTASRLVTTNDELVSSLEGIECIMIESMYLNNAGNLRRAWLTNRRAMVMGQMLGLHRGDGSPNAILEAETRDRIDPDYMWFRLVVSDRYLSLMLGLPQGCTENTFARPEALERCTAMERMERIMAVAGGLILQRNGAQKTDPATTRNIDKMLQEAAALMPPRWWLATSDSTVAGMLDSNDAAAFDESLRLMNQFAYRHLLVQLHLPYMLLPSSVDPSYDCSRMTAASASRAIVTQFVSFRTTIPATAYCRGIDFVAFVASTTLCLAHIEAFRQRATNVGKGVGVFQSLQHERLTDRGLLELTLEIMETQARDNHDAVAKKISSILGPLLVMEDNSARGLHYETSASEDDERESQPPGDVGAACNILQIQIPYFGTIKIEHRPAVEKAAKLAMHSAPHSLPTQTGKSYHQPLALNRLRNQNHQLGTKARRLLKSVTSTAYASLFRV